jgi:hypothetical protein
VAPHDALQRRAAAQVVRAGDAALCVVERHCAVSVSGRTEVALEWSLWLAAGSYGEDDEVVGGVGAVGDAGVRDDGDPVHGVDAQAGSGSGGRHGDVGARAAEDGDGDERLRGLRARRDRHQHLRGYGAARHINAQ